jgi:hypothetical protein
MYGIQTLRNGGTARDKWRGGSSRRRTHNITKNPQALAAATMKSVGISGLSGTQGAKGQKGRFKTEEGRLKKEYKDPNTSDNRKKQIVQDLAGVASDINRLNKVDAFNTINRTLGKKGFATSTDGTILTDSSGNPIMSSAGREIFDKQMDTWSDDRYKFKTGAAYPEGSKEQQEEKDLFKKVHPPFLARIAGEFSNLYKNVSPIAKILGKELGYNRGAFPRNDQFLREANLRGIANPELLKNIFYRGTDEQKYDALQQVTTPAYDPSGLEGYQDRIMRLGPQEEVTDITDNTNIETIKEEKLNKKIFNDPEILADVANFNRALKNPGIVNTLPSNFERTLNILKNTNNLASGDYLKALQLIDDTRLPNNVSSNLSSGILPLVQTAKVTDTDLKRKRQIMGAGYQDAIDMGIIDPAMTEFEFNQIKEGIITEPGTYEEVSQNILPYNFNRINQDYQTAKNSGMINPNMTEFEFNQITVPEWTKQLKDNKGFDVRYDNQEGVDFKYSTPLWGGNLETGIQGIGTSNPEAGLFFKKVI